VSDLSSITGHVAAGDPARRAVLFLCTGNYYRSRFAEILFNQHAFAERLPHRAISRGLAITKSNRGVISPNAVEGLLVRGIDAAYPVRFPVPLHRRDLEVADWIIAMDESEHRPMVARLFPE